MKLKDLIIQLCDYILTRSEYEDYLEFCADNGWDPNDYEGNTGHVYALARTIGREVEKL